MEIFNPENVPPFYRGYVEHVKNYTLPEALRSSLNFTTELIKSIPEEKGEFAYADGKWTIKEVLLHMIDAERVFCYRAMCFARNDKTHLPAFDENAYVPESNANSLSLKQILDATINLRVSTIDLFSSFSELMLSRKGIANKTELSVIGLGYITAGHQLHHCSILSQRYLNK